jgi:DnaJ family protein C protein 17
MAEDLDRRERDFKKSKGEEDQRDREKRSELERLKEEGRRMREAREKVNSGMVDRDEEVDRIREQERRRREMEEQTGVVELGLMDTTLTIKWAKPRRATIGDKDALLSFLRLLLNPLDPEVDMILSVDRIPKGRANVKFKTLAAAVRLMEAKGKGEGALWEGVEVNWAGKKAPDALGGAKVENKAPPSFASSFPISVRC